MRSVRTSEFMTRLSRLPKHVQEQAEKAFLLFCVDEFHPALRRHWLANSKSGRHRPDSFAVSIAYHYRAIGTIDNGPDGRDEPQYCWYWIGTHEEYNNFIGSK